MPVQCLYDEEQKGSISALDVVDGLIVACMGQKVCEPNSPYLPTVPPFPSPQLTLTLHPPSYPHPSPSLSPSPLTLTPHPHPLPSSSSSPYLDPCEPRDPTLAWTFDPHNEGSGVSG